METVVCTLCMDIFTISSNELDALGEMVKEMLDGVFSKENFLKIENPVVCKPCKENLQEALDFKSTYISTESCLYPYIKSNNKEIDLKVVYFNEIIADKTFKFHENDEVCRFCLSLTKSNTATELRSEIIKYDQFLWNVFPQLVLSNTSEAVICKCCHESLEKYAIFIKSCLAKASKIFQKEESCADKDNKIKTNSQTPVSHQLETCDIEIKEEPELTKHFALEFESLPLKTEQYMDIEEKPATHMGETLEAKTVKDECCSVPIFKTENLDDFIESQDIQIKSDNGSDGDVLDGGIEQKGNICQIISDQVENICLAQEERSIAKIFCDVELSKENIKIQEHLDKKEMFRNGTFRRHTLDPKNDSDIKMFKCGMCVYETKQNDHLKTHMLTHKDLWEIQMFKCEICDYEAKQKKYLTAHMLTHKEVSEIKMFKCGICDYEAKRKSCLKHHMLTHKDASEMNMFQCGNCAYQTKLETDQDISETEMFKCGICDYKGKHKYLLNRHMLTHKDESEIEMFKCVICSYKAKRKHQLTRHMLIHKDTPEIEMFICDICDYETKRKHYLKTHMLTHKDASEINMFKCGICTYEAKRKNYLIAHMLTHKDVSEIKMFKCGICNYEGKQKPYLKRHMLSHNDTPKKKKFERAVCAYETKQIINLNSHMLPYNSTGDDDENFNVTVKRETPFQCY